MTRRIKGCRMRQARAKTPSMGHKINDVKLPVNNLSIVASLRTPSLDAAAAAQSDPRMGSTVSVIEQYLHSHSSARVAIVNDHVMKCVDPNTEAKTNINMVSRVLEVC